MPAFRPGVGIEQIQPGERAGRQPVEQMRGVAEKQTDIGKLVLLDAGQGLGDGIDESVAADEAGAGMLRRLRQEMLAATETDFHADFLDLDGEQGAQVRGRRGIRVDRHLRQQRCKQRGLARPQGMAFAPAEEGALGIDLARLCRHGK
jgi:hypothetical protein